VPEPSISAFFPCYNDAKTIGDLVGQADRVLGELTDDYEIIVVNDGSRDESASVLAALTKQVPRLRLVHHLIKRFNPLGDFLRIRLYGNSKFLVHGFSFIIRGAAFELPRPLWVRVE